MARVGPQSQSPKKMKFTKEVRTEVCHSNCQTIRVPLFKYIRCYSSGGVEMCLCVIVALSGPHLHSPYDKLMNLEYRWNAN